MNIIYGNISNDKIKIEPIKIILGFLFVTFVYLFAYEAAAPKEIAAVQLPREAAKPPAELGTKIKEEKTAESGERVKTKDPNSSAGEQPKGSGQESIKSEKEKVPVTPEKVAQTQTSNDNQTDTSPTDTSPSVIKPPSTSKLVTNPTHVLVLVYKNNRLPASYVPVSMVVPNVKFSFAGFDEKKKMRQDAASALEKMFNQAREENIELYAVSGYRSYQRQTLIFQSNVNKYGEKAANQFSARPGESEHQTGLAMDITSASAGYKLSEDFGQTREGQWVNENAHKFGFIISYQKGKELITGYQYEPWHLRYVGIEAAKVITSQNFALEEYLDV